MTEAQRQTVSATSASSGPASPASPANGAPAALIDGKAVAARIRDRVALAAAALTRDHKVTPGLAVVLVGEDPASQVYVRNKVKLTKEAGMVSIEHTLPADTDQETLMGVVRTLNADPSVHGILVQMPLPGHLDTNAVLDAVDPAKDVDGLGIVNTGLLALGRPGLVPCTPSGVILLLKEHLGPDLKGKDALVLGRSILVGKPVAQLLLAEHCTVTIAHSRSQDLPDLVGRADIVVAAVGRPSMVEADWIKPGATVIDVGINRVPAPDKGPDKTRLVGDVDTEGALSVAGAITPVPGGVGPMTIACLLRNTVLAACRQMDISVPEGL